MCLKRKGLVVMSCWSPKPWLLTQDQSCFLEVHVCLVFYQNDASVNLCPKEVVRLSCFDSPISWISCEISSHVERVAIRQNKAFLEGCRSRYLLATDCLIAEVDVKCSEESDLKNTRQEDLRWRSGDANTDATKQVFEKLCYL